MTPENFCFWFQGFLEISNVTVIHEEALKEIKNHLKLVFNKVTPDLTPNNKSNEYKPKDNGYPWPVWNTNSPLVNSGFETSGYDHIKLCFINPDGIPSPSC